VPYFASGELASYFLTNAFRSSALKPEGSRRSVSTVKGAVRVVATASAVPPAKATSASVSTSATPNSGAPTRRRCFARAGGLLPATRLSSSEVVARGGRGSNPSPPCTTRERRQVFYISRGPPRKAVRWAEVTYKHGVGAAAGGDPRGRVESRGEGGQTVSTAENADAGSQLVSERMAGGILPRVLNSFDMVAIFVAIVLFITNVPGFYGNGPVSITYLLIGFLTFLVPGAIVTGQLAFLFPGEGSIYLWTHKAFGPFASFFAGFAAWWPGVLVMLATGSVVSQLLQYLGGWNFAAWVQGLVLLAVIALGAVLAALRLRLTQNAVNVIFVLYGLGILLVGLSAVLWLVQGHHSFTDFSHLGTATGGWFQGIDNDPLDVTSSSSTWSLYGFVILALLGIEVPLNMGVEVVRMKAITRYLLWGSVVVMLAYLLDNWALLVAADPRQGGNLAALLIPVDATMGPVLKWLVGLIFIGFFLFITVVYSFSFARLLFVSGLDRRLPPAVSRVNRHRVPHVAIIVQAVLAAVITLIVYMVVPALVGGDAADLSNRVYLVFQGAVTVIWCVSMVFLFVDILYLIRKFPEVFAARRIAHPALFWVCSVLGAISSFFGMWAVFTNPFSTQLFSKADWWHAVLVISLASLAIVPVLYLVGARTARAAPAPPAPPTAGPPPEPSGP
jgi:amino acid transporter